MAKSNKLTYAQIAEKLTQSYNKYDKQLQTAVTEAEKNSATRMLRRVSDNMNSLVMENQEAANVMDQKKQAPDSPNLSIGTRTANGYAYGGLSPIPDSNKGLPKLPKGVRNAMGYMQSGGQTLPAGVTEKNGVYTFPERVMDQKTYDFFKSLGGLDGVTSGKIVMPNNANPGTFLNVDQILNEIKQDEINKKEQEKAELIERRNAARARLFERPTAIQDNTRVDIPKLKNMPAIIADAPNPEDALQNMPAVTEDAPVDALQNLTESNKPSKGKGRLYNNVKAADFEDQMLKARAITGIEDFSATNPEHVKALQRAMLDKAGDNPSMFSGQEASILNEGGARSINNAGVDGKFGIDTLTALRQQGLSELTPAGFDLPNMEPTAELIQNIPMPTGTIPNEGPIESGGSGKFGDKLKGLGKNLPNQLAGISKIQEYLAHARAISDMQAPAPKNLEDPTYLNTQYNIAPQINAAEEQTALLARGLNANSTKRNNVRNNLAGLASGNQRNFNQLYADKFNRESQLQNMQTMANAKANQLNNNTIFDNENALLDFNNQKRNAKAKFASAITNDAMNLMTQRTNQRSQEAMLEALKPSWNKYGVMDRQYQDNGQNTELLKLLGLI